MAAVIPAVTKLSSRVIRILGCNPGPMTLQGTNTYLLGTGKSRILVDTGSDDMPQYITQLRNVLKHESCTISHVIVTHWHSDHLGGLPNVLDNLPTNVSENVDCRVWKHPGDASRSTSKERPRDDLGQLDEPRSKDPPLNDLCDGQKLSVDGATLKVYYTPGHSDDHVVLLLEEENALFSGDCILGEGTTVFEDLHDYLNSLEKILSIKPSVIYPGHGNIINEPIEKIKWYIDHRLQREKQIFDVMKKFNGPISTKDIVKRVYTDTPERLFLAAEVNVKHHLSKLAKENKVNNTESDMWVCKI